MIKAGHKGSTINEVVWMGDVVNERHTCQITRIRAQFLRNCIQTTLVAILTKQIRRC
jgi:hypothetical protein